MAAYAAASVALGFRASNLTNRGIVASGPYAIVRHPAYVTKNLAWWIGAVPFLISAAEKNPRLLPGVLFSLCAWSFVYYLRAVTEERHLKMAGNGYAEYVRKVPYRFIPGLW